MAVNKFFHTVLSGWVLGGVFVVGVSCWFLLKRRNIELAHKSIKIGGWVGLVGIVMTMWTGDGSAVAVSKYQPMKLAAMEGLYEGKCGQEIVAFGILNPDKTIDNEENPYLFDISLPYGLSVLAKHDANAFVPGINDLIDGVELTADGDTVKTDSYATRIAMGRKAHEALRAYGEAEKIGDEAAMAQASATLAENFKYFGYGYFNDVNEAVPPIALTFYAFHLMVIAGGYLLLFFVVALFLVYKKQQWLNNKIVQWMGLLTIPVVWICSQSGWITAEVGRQPWIIQDLMPTRAAISDITASSVQITFWMFVVLFTGLLVAEVCIMLKVIGRRSKEELVNEK
jgi:cytochrome d ubiquinol oxidase subunit I